ncbi:MAG TPA: hypothetical protein VH109_13705 [Steroidobacteraceae bacterium]|jgi:hypothetical protein|nr:hypothetical protein [Steroidobacteraceae bacterium]
MKADWLVALLAAGVGFALVSWLLSLARQQRAPPVAIQAPAGAASGRGRLSLAALGDGWPAVLGVTREATPEQIEAAYHARVAECDAVRFAGDAGDSAREEARARRADVEDAYEFIRALRR